MSFDEKTWVCTDPDTIQFRKVVSEKVFQFREFDHSLLNSNITHSMEYIKAKLNLNLYTFAEKYWDNEELWVDEEIDLNDYSEHQIKTTLDTYGYEYEDGEIIDSTGNAFKDNALIAECIFEQETQY